MAALSKTTWSQLEPTMRTELEAVIRTPNDAWVSQYQDAMAWWLLLLLVSVGGLIGLIVEFGADVGETVSLVASHPELLPNLFLQPHWLGLIACLVIAPWTAITWARNHRRRGLALTSTAIVVVRGATLKVLPLADITGIDSRVIGAVGKRFTVLTLQTKQGAKVELYTTGRWVSVVAAALGKT